MKYTVKAVQGIDFIAMLRFKALIWPLVAAVALTAAQPAQAKVSDAKELHCLALNIYFEARGEPNMGKHAVGHVVMNRVASRKFPGTVCKVIRQGGYKRRYRCQFSWWCDGRSDKPRSRQAWRDSRHIAQQVFTGISQDPTRGALWYHAESVKPYWRTAFHRGPTIGQHIFYSNGKTKRADVATPFTVAALDTLSAPKTATPLRLEPTDGDRGTIAMIGLGLMGLGFGARRRPV